MRWIAIVMLLVLVACTPQTAVQPVPQTQCKWPEIPNDSGCCRDMNENKVCDTIDLASEISAQKQQEYEQAAIKAQETANKSGKYRETIMNEVYANASAVKSYRFLYKGDEAVVANNSVMLRLVMDYQLGDREISGRRMKVLVNTVWLDILGKKAFAQCVPPEELVRQQRSTPCDAVVGIDFEVPFDKFAFKMPIKWVEEFLYRTPAEMLPGSHIGRRSTTLYTFTDLNDASRKTSLWIDSQTSMPLRVEVAKDGQIQESEDYIDLFVV